MSAPLVTWSPPTGVSISTLSSLPSPFFFTLTLQPGRASDTPKIKIRTKAKASRELPLSCLSMRMLRSFLCELCRPLDPCAALRDDGNADGQVAANCDLAKERFDR